MRELDAKGTYTVVEVSPVKDMGKLRAAPPDNVLLVKWDQFPNERKYRKYQEHHVYAIFRAESEVANEPEAPEVIKAPQDEEEDELPSYEAAGLD